MSDPLELMPVMLAYLMTADRGVCLADEESEIILANHKMAEIFSAPSYRDIVGKNIADFADLESNHPHREDVRDWLDRMQGDYLESSEVVCRNYNDEMIEVVVHGRRFFEVGGKIFMGCTITAVE